MANITLSQAVSLLPSTTSLSVSNISVDLDRGTALISFNQSGVFTPGLTKSVSVKLSDQTMSDLGDLVKQAIETNFGGGVTATVDATAVVSAKIGLGK